MRVRGPRLRIIRRLGVVLPGLTAKAPGRRTAPPGQHGLRAAARPARRSDYRVRLEEKQKLLANYGLRERQLRRYLGEARAEGAQAGSALLALLERRLDNVVFRLGLAPTIPAARQLVAHGHVAVDGRRSDRPGRILRPGESVRLATRYAARAAHVRPEGSAALRPPTFLAPDDDGLGGRVTGVPSRADVPFPVDEALIVEFYAR